MIVETDLKDIKVAIIGGGIAGTTAALRLAELGLSCTLFEASSQLVSGPPVCHLHAGGNLYRELTDEDCITLLEESIATAQVYRHSVNYRPTVIALPKRDKGSPVSLLRRLNLLQAHYHQLVKANPCNEVLGPVQDYFRLYDAATIRRLAKLPEPAEPQSLDDWMIPVARHLDFSAVQFPLIMVQEPGLSAFRIAATALQAAEHLPNLSLQLNCKVTGIALSESGKVWHVESKHRSGLAAQQSFDYLVNACGFKTGVLDDLLGVPRERLVEFKAAYVSRWNETNAVWPEVIFHGERGTPNGMAQLTPYPGGIFQLHGMTEDITLFEGGLVKSELGSSQPNLPEHFLQKVQHRWDHDELIQRSRAAIGHLAQFIPSFHAAQPAGPALYGAQQIPGNDPNCRTADVSFVGDRYARMEIVKANSAVSAANRIACHIESLRGRPFKGSSVDDYEIDGYEIDGIAVPVLGQDLYGLTSQFTQTLNVSEDAVDVLAQKLVVQRGYPAELAQRFGYPSLGSAGHSPRRSSSSENWPMTQFG